MSVTLRTLDGQEKQFPEREVEIPCFRCGLCCMFFQPQLDEIEVRHIAQALGLSRSAFQKRYLNSYQPQPGIYLLKRRRQACIFLRQEKERADCLIHRIKPHACRRWSPSLLRPECQEGLRRLRGNFLNPNQLYEDPGERQAFLQRMRDEQKETPGSAKTPPQGPRV